ncbi:hypothetical protein QJ856_gp0438 [Tupanvirus deep ocean]|uniref:Uncharacterized protein n=2 Tax=Tupanvirus TaxID=2094720 RepID=A0AC62A950_9VIRU|nr:hypothetical protein QJ856_gp0438 [Tupanvirus deep ocean]QKU34306.1 hypothetical protein [Tupanvirus deep ocean]
MTSITLNEQITPLEKIINKSINNLTFKEIISLVFHAASILSNDNMDTISQGWKDIYADFEKELEKQNKIKWPHMSITKNDYNRRMDIFSTGGSFISSKNIFMLMLRLLYVENYKRPYVYKSYNYHKILSYKPKITHDVCVKKLSISELFEHLKLCMKHYLKVYNDDKHFEYQLGKTINDIINE